MKLSVVIPVYNAEKYLEDCVISALEQDETGEVILVEDNSPDGCLEICRSLEKQFDNVRLLRHPDGVNRGPSASRNLGIKEATFDFVAFLDADDFYLPDRFKQTARLFREDSGIDGVYEAIGICFQNDSSMKKWRSLGTDDLTMLKETVPPKDLCIVLIRGGRGTISPDGLTVRKELFDKCGYFPDDMRLHQDTFLINKMAYYGNLVPGLPDVPVAVRRVHEANRYAAEFNTYRTRYILWKQMLDWALCSRIESDIKTAVFLNYIYCTYSLAVDRYSEGSKDADKAMEFATSLFRHPLLSIRSLREHFLRRRIR